MAYIRRRIKYRMQSCPECGAQLLKVAEGDIVIASPLLVCKDCGCISITKLHSEWYNHPKKWMLWGIPLIMAVATVLFLILCDYNTNQAFFGLGIIWIVCIVVTAKDVIRVIRSKKRMRDPKYLAELLRCKIIRREEYEEFLSKAQK